MRFAQWQTKEPSGPRSTGVDLAPPGRRYGDPCEHHEHAHGEAQNDQPDRNNLSHLHRGEHGLGDRLKCGMPSWPKSRLTGPGAWPVHAIKSVTRSWRNAVVSERKLSGVPAGSPEPKDTAGAGRTPGADHPGPEHIGQPSAPSARSAVPGADAAQPLAPEPTGPGRTEPIADPHRAASEGLPDGPDPRVGQRIGPYLLIGRLGAGGMGTVFLAERDHLGVRQQVALKVIRQGLGGADAVQRFRQERRILARLAHPNIARLFDGGETDAGQAYLVLEYVDGRPLLTFADNARLSIRRRVALFLELSRALSYAHQNLIVHRDIKPANVLVTGDGVLKLLDFGIAKPLDPLGDEASIYLTAPDQGLMTPLYASPEQLRGEPISVASDVYSAGLLLFQLLTGLHPLERPRDGLPTGHALIQAILAQERPAPSTLLSRIERAAQAKTGQSGPAGGLRGGPSGTRGLQGDGIAAGPVPGSRPRSRWWDAVAPRRAWKRLSGARMGSAPEPGAASRVAPTATLNMDPFAADAEQRASVSTGGTAGAGTAGNDPRARDVASTGLRGETAGGKPDGAASGPSPVTGCSLNQRVATILRERGEASMRQLVRRLKGDLDTILEKATDLKPERRYASMQDFADDLQAYLEGRPIRARPQSLAYRSGKFVRRHAWPLALVTTVLTASLVVSLLLARQVQVIAAERDAAEQARRETARIAEFQARQIEGIEPSVFASRILDQLLDDGDVLRKSTTALVPAGGFPASELVGLADGEQSLLASVLRRSNLTGITAAALRDTLLEPALVAAEREFAGDPPLLVRLYKSLAYSARHLGDIDWARIPLEKGAALARVTFGPFDPRSLRFELLDGLLHYDAGRMEDAADRFRRLLDRLDAGEPEAAELERVALRSLAATVLMAGDPAAARDLLAPLIAALPVVDPAQMAELDPEAAAEWVMARDGYARALAAEGDYPAAEAEIRWAVAAARALKRSGSQAEIGLLNLTESNLAFVLSQEGKWDEAVTLQEAVLQRWRELEGEYGNNTLTAMENLGTYYERLNRLEESEVLIRAALERRRRVFGERHPHTLSSRHNLAAILNSLGRNREAVAIYEQLLPDAEEELGRLHPLVLTMLNNWAFALAEIGDNRAAEPLAREQVARAGQVHGPEHPETLAARHLLVSLWEDQGRIDEALASQRDLVALADAALGASHWYVGVFGNQLGRLERAAGNPCAAAKAWQEAYQLFRQLLGPEHSRSQALAQQLAELEPDLAGGQCERD